jgi:quercetin dioxygenase-like cupin family protein
MEILRLEAGLAEPIGPRPYDVRLTSALELVEGEGEGEAHAYVLYFAPGGEIGPHRAGFGQLLVALSGGGWVAGGDGERHDVREGHAALITRGETHSKGSETGMTALMVQVRDLASVSG